jgi:hypothetical protein
MNTHPVKRAFLYISAIFYIAFALAYLFSFILIPKIYSGSDPISFLTGAEIIKTGNAKLLYDENLQFYYQKRLISPEQREWLLPFRSPPVVGFAFIPFTYLGLKFTYIFIIVFNLLNISLFSFIGFRLFKNIKRIKIFTISILYLPFLTTLIYGQFTSFLLLMLLLIYKFAKEKKGYLAGLTCGILLIKPQYFLLVPFLYLLMNNKKDFVKGVLISSIAMLLANLLISGYDALLTYPKFLMATEATSYGSRPYQTFTLFAFMKLIGTKYLSNWLPLLINFVLYFTSVVIFNKKLKRFSLEKSFIIGIILTILFSVHALSHDLTILLIPIFILLNLIFEGVRKRPSLYLPIALLLYFLPLFIVINGAVIGVVLLLMVTLQLFLTKDPLGKISTISLNSY